MVWKPLTKRDRITDSWFARSDDWDVHLQIIMEDLQRNWHLDRASRAIAEAPNLPDPSDTVADLQAGRMLLHVIADPDVGLNAQISASRTEASIFIGTPLLALLRELCFAIGASTEYQIQGGRVPNRVSVEQASVRLGDAVDRALSGRPMQRKHLPVSRRGEAEAYYLFHTGVRFALAHEMGHLLAGHLRGEMKRVTVEPIAGVVVPEHVYSGADELTADEVAAILLPTPDDLPEEYWFIGAIVLFELLEIIYMGRLALTFPADQHLNQLMVRGASTHPHPAHRRQSTIRAGRLVTPDLGSHPECDNLLSRIEALTGRTQKPRNKEACIALLQLADSGIRAALTEIFRLSRSSGTGVRSVLVADVAALVGSTELDRATRVVATATEIYLDQVYAEQRASCAESQAMLGHVYSQFSMDFLENEATTAEAHAFDRLVRQALPELDDCVLLWAQMLAVH